MITVKITNRCLQVPAFFNEVTKDKLLPYSEIKTDIFFSIVKMRCCV